MPYVLTVAVCVAVAVVALLLYRGRRAAVEVREPRGPRDPFDAAELAAGDPRGLRAGDLVEYLGERYFVRGSLRLRQGGYTWSEHFLDTVSEDGGGRRWISVEEDPDLEVTLWEPYRAAELSPGARSLTVEGVTYQRTEHGTADYRAEGTTGVPPTGRVEYADFEGPGSRGLAFERFLGADGSGTWEASLGERVPNGTLVIYPGSDT